MGIKVNRVNGSSASSEGRELGGEPVAQGSPQDAS